VIEKQLKRGRLFVKCCCWESGSGKVRRWNRHTRYRAPNSALHSQSLLKQVKLIHPGRYIYIHLSLPQPNLAPAPKNDARCTTILSLPALISSYTMSAMPSAHHGRTGSHVPLVQSPVPRVLLQRHRVRLVSFLQHSIPPFLWCALLCSLDI